MMVPLSPALTVSSPTALFLLSPPLLLRRRLRLTLRPTHGCSTTGWDMLLAHTAMVITDI